MQAFGQGVILRTRVSVSRRMIMAENNTGSQCVDSRFQYDTQVGGGFGRSSLADPGFSGHFSGPVCQGNP